MNKVEREESSVEKPTDPVFYEATDSKYFSVLGDIYIRYEPLEDVSPIYVNIRTGNWLHDNRGLTPLPVGARFTVTVGE